MVWLAPDKQLNWGDDVHHIYAKQICKIQMKYEYHEIPLYPLTIEW